jgi:hypothetical protein
MAVAQRLAMFSLTLGKEPDVVKQAFENAYRDEHEKSMHPTPFCHNL